MARAATFTTYLNAEKNPNVDRVFNQFAQQAVSKYATITKAANTANAASAGLLSGGGNASAASAVTRSLRDREQAITGMTRATSAAIAPANALGTTLRRETSEVNRAAQGHQNLAKSLQTTATALNVVQGPLGPISGRVRALANAVSELTGFRLGLVGVGASLFAIARLGNDYSVLQSKLRPFFDTQQQTNAAMENAIGIAGRSRQSLTATIDLYSRLTAVSKDYGLSQATVARVTEAASKAALLSGGTAQTREAGLLQFSQAIGSGKLGGDELRSILENIPVLAQTIAHNFQNADGSIGTTMGNLRKLGAQGQLTTDKIVAAAQRGLPQLTANVEKLPVTLSSASTQFVNSLTVMIGRFDQATKFTGTLASGIALVGDNLRGIVGLAIGFGAAFAAPKVVAGLASIQTKISDTVTEIQRQNLAERNNAQARIVYAAQAERESAAQVAEIRARVTALGTERAAIVANIEALEAEKLVAQEAAAAARASTFNRGAFPGATAGISGDLANLKAATATRALSQEQEKLRTVEGALRAETGLLARGNIELSTNVARSMEEIAKGVPKVGIMRTALGGLKTAGMAVVDLFGGPWGIALALATTALYLLATAESKAEQATRENEQAQADFGAVVDSTTGKIYAQIGALERQKFAQQQVDNYTDQREGVQEAKKQIVGSVKTLLNPISVLNSRDFKTLGTVEQRRALLNTPEYKAIIAAVADLQAEKPGSATRLQNLLNKNGGKIPGFKGSVSGFLGGQFSTLRVAELGDPNKPGSGLVAQAARARIAQGRPLPGDYELASGKTSAYTAPTGKPKSKAQIDADARAQAAQNDVQRAQAKLAQVKAGGKEPNETDVQYQDRLADAYKAVTDAQNAKTAAGKAASAGAAAARKQARDAIQDAKDQAAATRDAALTALYASGKDENSQEFIQERIKILKTYDDQVNKIDASAAASRSATAQMIQDAKDLAKASAGRGEKRDSILANYDETPKAVDRADAASKSLERMVGLAVDGIAFLGKTEDEIEKIKAINPLGTGIYTRAMADSDQAQIDRGLRKPLRDIFEQGQQQVEISRLLLEGRDAEAAALQKAFQLYGDIGHISQQEYEALVKNEEEQLRINDALASRNRIISTITGALDDARGSLTGFLVDMESGAKPSVGKLFNDLKTSIFKISAQKITENFFAGADQRIRDLVSGKSKTDQAVDKFATTLGRAESATDRIVDAFDTAADKIVAAADRIANAGTAPVTTPSVGDTATNTIASALNGNATSLPAIIGLTSSVIAGLGQHQHGEGIGNGDAANDNNGDIVVSAVRTLVKQQADFPSANTLFSTPSAKAASQAIFGGVFGGLDKLINRLGGKKTLPDGTVTKDGVVTTGSTFFKGVGKAFGNALEGAGQGAFASSIVSKIGIKQDATGAGIGGAVGGILNSIKPIAAALGPFGAALSPLLGILGGTLGSLFTKPKFGTASVSLNQYGEAVGGAGAGLGGAAISGATGSASSVAQGINSIAQQLGATITGLPNITIGSFDGKARVDLQGRTGSLDSKHAPGVLDFGKDGEAAAIEYAIRYSVSHAVITGISQASKNIIASGQDLQQAIQKAIAIESIPKQLLRLTNPVKAAVSELNDQFSTLISYLQEGGATAEQFADAQKLYDLQRADAIKQATNDAASAIDDFLKEMLGGSDSPYNKRTVYENAATHLDTFKSDIASGKVVDQNDLLTAARNFEDASRALNGSSSDFFSDFDALRALLEKARDNAGITDVSTLPGSPFADTSIQDIINKVATNDAIAAQTATLMQGLGSIAAAINSNGVLGPRIPYNDNAIDLLPNFNF